MTRISFKPKQVTKRLLAVLPERARDILTHRYGLGAQTEPLTLEAIGNTYGITRERVRQIENYALSTIRKSDALATEQAVFDELVRIIDEMGGIVSENELLKVLAKDHSTQNYIHFLLVVGEPFKKKKEDAEFQHRWYVDETFAERIHSALRKLYTNLSDDDLVSEAELISNFLEEVKDLNEQYKDEEIARRWLSLSKTIGKNPLGEWGVSASPNVRAKGMRDYAYLTIKRHGSPMHFTEVARAISELFNRKAHVATCHNELIKDARFVLVGRGLYALSEWGYSAGVVKDVIKEILRKQGPLTRDQIISRVKKERYVKDNTILVNLQDSKTFVKDKDGKYRLAE
jgi:DNA-directed RNA polymerase delta subunit